tara:strand:+ start:58 stop:300 length:243 start_codon:yes stop_codon:yes gene_type:complete
MTYYLLLDGDSEQDTLYDTNVLGEESFGTFYVSMGFSLLQKILNERKEIIDTVKIIDERKRTYTIEEFVEKLGRLRIKSS